MYGVVGLESSSPSACRPSSTFAFPTYTVRTGIRELGLAWLIQNMRIRQVPPQMTTHHLSSCGDKDEHRASGLGGEPAPCPRKHHYSPGELAGLRFISSVFCRRVRGAMSSRHPQEVHGYNAVPRAWCGADPWIYSETRSRHSLRRCTKQSQQTKRCSQRIIPPLGTRYILSPFRVDQVKHVRCSTAAYMRVYTNARFHIYKNDLVYRFLSSSALSLLIRRVGYATLFIFL